MLFRALQAGNENAKVNEVIFINSLNSEGIAEQLQQKLEEVEARILAASERRQQRLAGIGNRSVSYGYFTYFHLDH